MPYLLRDNNYLAKPNLYLNYPFNFDVGAWTEGNGETQGETVILYDLNSFLLHTMIDSVVNQHWA